MERGWRDITPNCPRCGSSNTKFCYYNNYSLTQPRYFCKGCRRYWTKGGSLRNVPVGGGCRRSRRSLRLVGASSNPPKTSNINTNIPIFGQVGTNDSIQVLPLNSYNSDGDLSNLVESSRPSTNSEAPPTINLAVVYANFLNQKGNNDHAVLSSSVSFRDQNTSESIVQVSQFRDPPPNVDFSSIPDATTIVRSTQIINILDNNNNNNNPPFTQTLSLPQLNNEHGHNQFFDTATFDPTSIIHDNCHENASIQQESGLEPELPPLPGESSSHDHQQMQWISSGNNNNNMQASRIPELEQNDAQYSSLFGGHWMGPIDLPGFETTSSPSKP